MDILKRLFQVLHWLALLPMPIVILLELQGGDIGDETIVFLFISLIPYIIILAFILVFLKDGKIKFKLSNYVKLLSLISFIGILMYHY